MSLIFFFTYITTLFIYTTTQKKKRKKYVVLKNKLNFSLIKLTMLGIDFIYIVNYYYSFFLLLKFCSNILWLFPLTFLFPFFYNYITFSFVFPI